MAQSSADTRKAGYSLAKTLYATPVTVALTGPLGAGKTSFLQGFAEGLGVSEQLTSPTYALEQRYFSPRGAVVHLDLYRLSEAQSAEFLRGSDDADIRCIEWSERVTIPHLVRGGPVIHIDLDEGPHRDERKIHVAFHDALLPSENEIQTWRKDVLLPQHIVDHCEAVAGFAATLADHLMGSGHLIRKEAVRRAAQIHDLFRFLDFRPGGHPSNDHAEEVRSLWEGIRARYPGLHHEAACAAFLQEHGFSVLSTIVAVHGLTVPPPEDGTIEQKILFYADKRVLIDRVVTLEERFADFAQRYGKGVVSEDAKRWYAMTIEIERELFPDGVPS